MAPISTPSSVERPAALAALMSTDKDTISKTANRERGHLTKLILGRFESGVSNVGGHRGDGRSEAWLYAWLGRLVDPQTGDLHGDSSTQSQG
ncbi:hypothetical protein HYQ46_010011 [Verticillium longisporum]|nr:hypothetical protein HYQ46_010011 [Verticillium longisporum]